MSIESWDNSSRLPEGLEWIKNERDFMDVYENIKSWYGESFSSSEQALIKDSRNSSSAEYGWVFNDTKKVIASNRIDSILFRLRYVKFSNLDKNHIMKTLSNANTQRKFREIITKLWNRFGELYNSEIDKIEKRLQDEIKKAPRSDSAIFDTIYEDLYTDIEWNRNTSTEQPEWQPDQNQDWWEEWYNNWINENINNTPEISDNNESIAWNTWINQPWRIPKSEIELMDQIQIPEGFKKLKDCILSSISFSEFSYHDKDWNIKTMSEDNINYIKKYTSAVFNDFVKTFLDSWDIPASFLLNTDENVLGIVIAYMQDVADGKETWAENLITKICDAYYSDDDRVSNHINKMTEEINQSDAMKKIDPEELEKVEITDKELDDIKINLGDKDSEDTMENLKQLYKTYKYLSKRKNDLWELEPELETLLQKLDKMFMYIKRRVLREISSQNIRESGNFWLRQKSLSFSPEQATWNIKDIEPIAIVETNQQIRRFVYWNIEQWNDSEDMNISLSPTEREQLFNKLKVQKAWDPDFNDSIIYLDRYWNIDRDKAMADNIDPESLENNKRKIDEMIRNLAIEEKRNRLWKDKIKEVSRRRSIMTTCFRAISSFFDTVNNNSENFASEFEIENVNENIEFDERTWIIKVKWTIWENKNHIWLYYNTHTWELSFDNFLAFNPDVGYKIWKWNWEREPLKIQLPTMDKMEAIANSINFDLIDSLPLNMRQYDRMVWLAMSESIWFNCFKGFMGADMEVNRQFVAQFTEKNILKQDIIKTIYKKFYNERDLDDIFNNENKYLTIGEGNEPEQFKLIKLISDSIDHYESADQLLNFRLYVNQLDGFLASKETIQKDKLLRALFADNLSSNNDNYDVSRQVMQRENENLNVSEDNTTNTYTSQEQSSIMWNNGELWDYILLDLFSEDKWWKRIINLDWLNNALTIMARTDDWSSILDMAEEYAWFERNLQAHAEDLPDFQTQILQENIDQIA